MANKPKSDNYDALGSVFDFLFEESKKPPERRRPITPTGIAADSELTDGIFAALERPGAFVSDTVISEFNDALNVEIGRIKYGEYGSVKFTTMGMIDFLRDPAAAFDKAIKTQNAIRKSQRALFLGALAEDVITTAWAHKYGDEEAKRAVLGGTISRADSYAIERALGQYGASHSGDPQSKIQGTAVGGRFSPRDLDFMANRSFELLGRKTFGSSWLSLSEKDKADFSKLLGESGPDGSLANSRLEVGRELFRRYGHTIPDIETRFTGAVGGVLKESEGVDIFAGKLYKSLERDNLDDRIADPTISDEQRGVYKKARYILDRDRLELNNTIEQLRTDLKSATTSAEKKRLRKELRDAKGALRVVNGHTLLGRIGQLEGYYNSFSNLYGANFVGSILNGSIYDKNLNSLFLPSSEKTVGGVDGILVKREVPSKMLGKYNQVMTNLNYLTPRSIFKTFFYNGEGFAYLLNNRLDKIKKLPGFDKLAGLGITAESLDAGFSSKDIDTFVENLLNSLAGNKDVDLQELTKLLNSGKTFKKLTHAFSGIYRVQQKANQFFQGKLKDVRTKVMDWLLKNPTVRNWFVKSQALHLLEKWVAKGGIDVFVRSLIGAAAAALGITLGPIGTVVAALLTQAISGFVMRVIGQLFVIAKYALIGLFGVIAVVWFTAASATKSFFRKNFSYYHTVPGTTIMCSAYEEQELTSGEYPWGQPIIPPPSGEQCLFGAGSYGCSQGYKDVQGWSHQNYTSNMPVDLTSVGNIYAPQFCSSGDCRITRIAVINCRDNSKAGGIVELTASDGVNTYFFKFLHVKPLASLGEKLGSGQAVAVVQLPPEVEVGNCWTGVHLHLETKQNGSVVDPLSLLQSFGCSVPDESGCSRPR
ncbi:MAG: M23 family metallopeptidase [Candidatus Dojkabacteria bacterium]|jgi:hypothetical protein